MGGNALSKPSVRLNKEDYFNLWNKLSLSFSQLKESNKIDKFDLIPAYSSKESFGDADILVFTENQNYKQDIRDSINATEMKMNGNVTSYGVNTVSGVFQIDIVFSSLEDYDFALNYYSYNDVNNLIGRTARFICKEDKYSTKGHYGGFKHGHDGLWYILRDAEEDTRVIKEIDVTKDYNKAINFLGYKESFKPDTKEDIFNYAISSEYSSFDVFDLKNRNHAARTRDSKRAIYTEFCEWLETNKIDKKCKIENLHEIKLKEAFKIFDGFKDKYDHSLFRHEERNKYRLKYNGDLVSSLTGLSGRDLGKFMEKFKISTGKTGDDFIDTINLMSEEEVYAKIKELNV